MRETAIRTDIILIKLREMIESVDLVKSHIPDSEEEFCRLGLLKDGIYKRIEYAIENVFDICAIFNADLQLGIPRGDEDIVVHLVKHGILSTTMNEKLRSMKGFRNLVVHRYGAINDALAYSILQDHIDDFSLFYEEIERYLECMA